MITTKPRKRIHRPGRVLKISTLPSPVPLERLQEPPPGPIAPLPIGRPAAVSTALLRTLQAGWARGGPVRAVTVAIPAVVVLALCWYIVLPVVAAVMAAVFHVAALVAAAGISVRVVAWALGAAPVKAAAMQLGMAVLLCWCASLFAAA